MGRWVAVVLTLILAGCSSSEETGSIDTTAFIAEVESWEGVLDVAVSDDQRIYVGMHDNGRSRDGYAMTVCEELRAHASGDLKDRYVTILDAVAALRNDDFKPLGKHRCTFHG